MQNISGQEPSTWDRIGAEGRGASVAKLEEFSSVCGGVVANFGKKFGVGEGFVIKKTTGVRLQSFKGHK